LVEFAREPEPLSPPLPVTEYWAESGALCEGANAVTPPAAISATISRYAPTSRSPNFTGYRACYRERHWNEPGRHAPLGIPLGGAGTIDAFLDRQPLDSGKASPPLLSIPDAPGPTAVRRSSNPFPWSGSQTTTAGSIPGPLRYPASTGHNYCGLETCRYFRGPQERSELDAI